ncbi:MAG: hypothetical protein ABIR06_00075 [Cyclobacteriaceae bacterium]
MKTPSVWQVTIGKNLMLSAIIVVMYISCHPVAAQNRDTTAFFQVETADGNEYIGKIIDEDNEKIRLKTDKLGELTLRKIDILKISPVNITNIKNGVYWFGNPQSTRYFWSPNGYGLKKGEGYYQNIWVLFSQFSVGVTDNFSLGGGLVPLFLFGGGSTPVWLTPKVSIPVQKDKFNIGVGGLFGTVLGESNTGFGIAYGLTTFGSRDKNLSLGLGYGYANGDWANTPTITFSSMIRTGQRGYFLTENYYIGTGDAYLVLLSMGGRRIIKKAGLDFGVFIPIAKDVDNFIAIPWLGLTVPFGNTQKK